MLRRVELTDGRAYGGSCTKRGLRVGKQRVQRLMQEHGIRACGKRRFRVITTDSRHGLPVAPNLLERNFSPTRPDTAWSGDITYIATEEGWLFLAVVIDLFGQRVVGWSLQPHMQRSMVIDALEMAWQQRRPAKGALLFHNDRGSQYASEDFTRTLDEHGIIASMSRKGNCWDNACSETLFGSLKVEWLRGKRFVTIREAKNAVFAHRPRGEHAVTRPAGLDDRFLEEAARHWHGHETVH